MKTLANPWSQCKLHSCHERGLKIVKTHIMPPHTGAGVSLLSRTAEKIMCHRTFLHCGHRAGLKGMDFFRIFIRQTKLERPGIRARGT